MKKMWILIGLCVGCVFSSGAQPMPPGRGPGGAPHGISGRMPGPHPGMPGPHPGMPGPGRMFCPPPPPPPPPQWYHRYSDDYSGVRRAADIVGLVGASVLTARALAAPSVVVTQPPPVVVTQPPPVIVQESPRPQKITVLPDGRKIIEY